MDPVRGLLAGLTIDAIAALPEREARELLVRLVRAAGVGIDVLPDEILAEILMCTPPVGMSALCCSSRRFAAICRDGELWRLRAHRDLRFYLRYRTLEEFNAINHSAFASWAGVYFALRPLSTGDSRVKWTGAMGHVEANIIVQRARFEKFLAQPSRTSYEAAMSTYPPPLLHNWRHFTDMCFQPPVTRITKGVRIRRDAKIYTLLVLHKCEFRQTLCHLAERYLKEAEEKEREVRGEIIMYMLTRSDPVLLEHEAYFDLPPWMSYPYRHGDSLYEALVHLITARHLPAVRILATLPAALPLPPDVRAKVLQTAAAVGGEMAQLVGRAWGSNLENLEAPVAARSPLPPLSAVFRFSPY